MCVDMCVEVCVDMFVVDMFVDMFVDMCVDMCIAIHVDVCLNMCAGMCVDMCVDMCATDPSAAGSQVRPWQHAIEASTAERRNLQRLWQFVHTSASPTAMAIARV